ncbi:MAG: sigma-70 family RNA polymerase sigma factor [Clostridia bacterium]|nr:sigma-70 family RNA polymerase sigma factor [Clostridia bacterium]
MNGEEMNTIDALYIKYYRELYNYSFSLFDYKQQYLQDAEDCVQETFEKAVKHKRYVTNHPTPLLCLKKMCYNITVTRRRNMKNRNRILGYPEPMELHYDACDPRDIIMDWVLRQENRETKEKLMQALTENEKDTYRAYYENDMTIRETADYLQITEGAVRGCLQRIKKKASKLKIFGFFLLIQCIFSFWRT